jgi:hypothetical protein
MNEREKKLAEKTISLKSLIEEKHDLDSRTCPGIYFERRKETIKLIVNKAK